MRKRVRGLTCTQTVQQKKLGGGKWKEREERQNETDDAKDEQKRKSYLTQGTQNLPHLKPRKKRETRTEKKVGRRQLNISSAVMKWTIAWDAKQKWLLCAVRVHKHRQEHTHAVAHHFMLLLHLCNLLCVLLVHLLQFRDHAFTALVQSLFIIDKLQTDWLYLRAPGKHSVTDRQSVCVTYLINESEVSLDGGFILFLLQV